MERLEIPGGASALLAQEVRSPFAGRFVLTLRCCGEGSSRECYESVLLEQFTCRLMFYQYADASKNPLKRKELASLTIQPKLVNPESPAMETFVLEKIFENPKPGQNFSFGLGLGVAIVVEKNGSAALALPAADAPRSAWIRVQSLELEFSGKPLKEDVTV
jgi:hypothetical protein